MATEIDEDDYEAALSKLAKDLWGEMSADDRAKLVDLMNSQNKNEKGEEPSSSSSLVPMQPPSSKGSCVDGADTSEGDGDHDPIFISDSESEVDDVADDDENSEHVGDDQPAHENGNGEGAKANNGHSVGSESVPGGDDPEEKSESSDDSDSDASYSEPTSDSTSGDDDDEVEDDPKVEEPKQPAPDLPEESDNEIESDMDDNISVITISDSDDEEEPDETGQPPRKMICFRCQTPKNPGTFKNKKKFQFHIKRHTFGENFSCPTCKRPFLNLNLCVAHEIRVHSTEIDPACYNRRDPLVLAAKGFLKRKKKEQKRRSNDKNNNEQVPTSSPGSSSPTGETSEVVLTSETGRAYDVYEEEGIYDGHVVTSTSFLTYRGPPVDHIVQCYEIQQNFGGAKNQNPENVKIGRKAMLLHKRRVEQGYVNDMLGQFTKRNIRLKRFLPVPAPFPRAGPSTRAQANSKELLEAGSVGEPKKKRGRPA